MLVGLPFAASAQTFPLPTDGDTVVGRPRMVVARFEDTLVDLARRYDVGFHEIIQANPDVDPWLPGAGTRIRLPTRFILPHAPHRGIVINVAELRLYYYPESGGRSGPSEVITHPVSIGRGDWKTPEGATRVIAKIKDPAWYPPESIRKEHAERGDDLPARVPPGPDNPLGQYALRLALPGYLIHGTNKPRGIGMRVTHGCIRLHSRDIKALFQQVPVGTPVNIVNQNFKTGWHNGALFLEVHPTITAFGEQPLPVDNLTGLVGNLIESTRQRPDYAIDWAKVRAMVVRHSGRPGSIERQRSRAHLASQAEPAAAGSAD